MISDQTVAEQEDFISGNGESEEGSGVSCTLGKSLC